MFTKALYFMKASTRRPRTASAEGQLEVCWNLVQYWQDRCVQADNQRLASLRQHWPFQV